MSRDDFFCGVLFFTILTGLKKAVFVYGHWHLLTKNGFFPQFERYYIAIVQLTTMKQASDYTYFQLNVLDLHSRLPMVPSTKRLD